MRNPRSVVGNIHHPRVLNDQAVVRRQREVGAPDAVAAAVVDERWLRVEEGDVVPIQQPPYLCLAAGLVRRFKWIKAVKT